MKRTVHWLFLGMAVAGVAAGAAAVARLLLRPPGQPTESERRAMIERVLDRDAGNIFCFDPDISYRLKPSFLGRRHDSLTLPHRTNSYGMLGEREPETETSHILLLGDSVVYGEYLPREDSFAARLEEEAPAGRQVLTAACPGWSTHQEIGYWEKYLAGVRWERVFVFFCLNDLLRFEWVWGGEDRFRISEEVAGLGGLLATHCRSVKLRFLRGAFADNPGLGPLAGLNNTCLVPFLKEWWDAYEEAVGPRLRSMNATVPVTVVGLPAREQLAALNAGGNPEEVMAPQERLRQFCRSLNLDYLDALPAFEEPGTGAYRIDCFLPGQEGELHLSRAGHAALAAFLAPRVFCPVPPAPGERAAPASSPERVPAGTGPEPGR